MLNNLSMTPTRKSPLSPVTFLSLILAISILATSCQKGDTGPVGPAGPGGATGAQGPQGDTGTANVIYSNWFTPASYVKDTIFGTWGFYFNEAAPAITAGILDS